MKKVIVETLCNARDKIYELKDVASQLDLEDHAASIPKTQLLCDSIRDDLRHAIDLINRCEVEPSTRKDW